MELSCIFYKSYVKYSTKIKQATLRWANLRSFNSRLSLSISVRALRSTKSSASSRYFARPSHNPHCNWLAALSTAPNALLKLRPWLLYVHPASPARVISDVMPIFNHICKLRSILMIIGVVFVF